MANHQAEIEALYKDMGQLRNRVAELEDTNERHRRYHINLIATLVVMGFILILFATQFPTESNGTLILMGAATALLSTAIVATFAHIPWLTTY